MSLYVLGKIDFSKIEESFIAIFTSAPQKILFGQITKFLSTIMIYIATTKLLIVLF